VRRHFGPEGKDRTTRLVAEIEEAMERDNAALPWMDAATKRAAHEKLARVVNKVGYPETWRDYSAMEVGRGAFLRNLVAAGRFEVDRQLAKVGKPVDRSEWFMSPPTVNAYYSPSMNEMVFPAGILQPPFFNGVAPEPVNYGAIGMVVGHELTHGFDDQGRQFDAEGNLRDWWSPQVARAFDARAQCLVRQYGAYEPLPGVKLDGKLTLGENIADLGGLELSFAAMNAALQGRDAPALHGFTPEQQFFVGYAQSWCTKRREQDERRRAILDVHAPPRFRVNGPLSNLPEFAAAFACEEGSAMARPAAERCEVW
jgi:endothelin-converting enzyme/putative endopeptidase